MIRSTIKMGGGMALVGLAAILTPPLMARYWDDRQLALAAIAILVHNLTGTIDVFKSVIIRRVSKDERFATRLNILLPSFALSSIISMLIVAIGGCFLSEEYEAICYAIAAVVFLYGLYSPLWGLLSAQLRVSDAYLVRASSVAMLYIMLGVGALFGHDQVIYVSLVASNIMPAIAFSIMARGGFKGNGWTVDSLYWREVGAVFLQNSARGVNDFGDRLLAAFFLPISMSGSYMLLSDVSSRVNFATPLITMQAYPALCRDREKGAGILLLGIGLSAIILLMSIGLFVFGRGLYNWYLGSAMSDFFWLFCCMLLSFGVYTLSFFGQAILRSRSMDSVLFASFAFPAVLIVLYLCLVLVTRSELSLRDVAVMMMVSKFSALSMMVGLYRIYPFHAVMGVALCSVGAASVLYILSVS